MVQFPSILEDDDLPDNLFLLPYFAGTAGTESSSGSVGIGINDEDTIKILVHDTAITEGTAVSVHLRDDSTSYQNNSGGNASAILLITGESAGTESRHVKVWSSPNDNSTTSATLILDIDQPGVLNANGEAMTVVCPKIQSGHYLVIENVDESRAGANDVHIPNVLVSYVVERG